MKRINFFHGLMAVALLGGATPVLADAVTDWNEITVQAVSAGRPGPIGAVDIALVQVAVHDAVQAIDRQFEPYHAQIAGRGERAQGRRSAAVAAAAHDVLVGMYPAQAATLDATYFSYLADKGLDNDPGLLSGNRSPRVFFRYAARIRIPCRHPLSVEPALVPGDRPRRSSEIRPRQRRSRRWLHPGWRISTHSRSRARRDFAPRHHRH